MSLISPSVMPQIEGLSDDEMSELIVLRKEKKLCVSSVSSTNILHQPLSIHLMPPAAGTALVESPLGLRICSPAHNDSVAYVRTGSCVIQPAATATLSSENLILYAILQKQGRSGWALGGFSIMVNNEKPQGGSQRS